MSRLLDLSQMTFHASSVCRKCVWGGGRAGVGGVGGGKSTLVIARFTTKHINQASHWLIHYSLSFDRQILTIKL